MHSRFFLTTMVVVQAAWLGAIWLSGAAAHWQKLPVLIVYSAICGAVLITLPMSKRARVAQFARRWVETECPALPILTLGVAGVGALYAYQQLGWPDERMVFAASSIVAEQGLEAFFAQYPTIPWLGSQHPPLVPLLYGGVLRLCGAHIYVIRSVGLMFSIATLCLTYRIGKELYSHHIGLLAACFLISMPFFFRLGTTALLDMPATFFFTLSVYTTLRLLQNPTALLAVVVGLSVGAGLLCRYTVVLIYPVLVSCTVVRGVFRRDIPYLGIVLVVSVSLLAIWLIAKVTNI